jgi:hypothetical protein
VQESFIEEAISTWHWFIVGSLDGYVLLKARGGTMATTTAIMFGILGMKTSLATLFNLMMYAKDDGYKNWITHSNSAGVAGSFLHCFNGYSSSCNCHPWQRWYWPCVATGTVSTANLLVRAALSSWTQRHFVHSWALRTVTSTQVCLQD